MCMISKHEQAWSGRDARSRSKCAAFTLIEILVAMAVLGLLTLLVAQVVQSGSALIAGSRKHLGADAQARDVFNLFGVDLKKIPRRADMDVVLSSDNNAVFFFCEGTGYHGGSPGSQRNTLALVGYRVNAKAELERLGKGLSWNDPLFLTYAGGNPNDGALDVSSSLAGAWGAAIGTAPTYTDGADSDYQVLAPGVFRIYFCFQLKDGTYSEALPSAPDQWKLAPAAGIILTLAILDGESRKIVSDPTQLAGALPDPTSSDLAAMVLPAKLWQDAIDDTGQFASTAGIPVAAASRVRIYQRSFPLGAQ